MRDLAVSQRPQLARVKRVNCTAYRRSAKDGRIRTAERQLSSVLLWRPRIEGEGDVGLQEYCSWLARAQDGTKYAYPNQKPVASQGQSVSSPFLAGVLVSCGLQRCEAKWEPSMIDLSATAHIPVPGRVRSLAPEAHACQSFSNLTSTKW